MDSHYENEMFLVEGIDLAIRDLRAQGIKDMKVVKLRYFEFISQATLQTVFPYGFPGWPLEHAGVMTTSILMHLRPELVHVDRIPKDPPTAYPPYDIFPPDSKIASATGVLASAAGATAAKGKLLFDELVDTIAAAMPDAFGLARA